MDLQKLELEEVLETFQEPLGLSDAQGKMVYLNQAAQQMLGVEEGAVASLSLDERATFSSMRLSLGDSALDRREFFLADVPIEGTDREHVSVALAGLSNGGFRVKFMAEEREPTSAPPVVRLFQALGTLAPGAQLFDQPQEVMALYSSALSEVFPRYGFVVQLVDGEQTLAEQILQPDNLRSVLARDLPLQQQRFAHREGEQQLRLQVQTARKRGFTQAERETFTLFLLLTGFQLGLGGKGIGASDTEPEPLQSVAPIFNELHALIAICDGRRAIRACNRAFERALGKEKSGDLLGHDILDFFEEPAREALRARASAALSGTISTQPFSIELPLLPHFHEPGTVSEEETLQQLRRDLTFDVHLTPLEDASSGFVLIAQPSAVALEQLEAHFARAEELMNLGQLASGVAHELKNPLTSILNYANYLLQKYRDQLFENRDSERLQRIIDGVERIDRFVRDLVTYAKPDEGQLERFSIHESLRDARMLCEFELEQHQTSLQMEPMAEDVEIRGVRSHITQVFVNLIINAAHAMPEEGGQIIVETENHEQHLLVRLRDTAGGIPEEHLDKIFEPFFTTRRHEGGSGLGLAMVRTIIERHGGEVWVKSSEGLGTTFHLKLPLAPV